MYYQLEKIIFYLLFLFPPFLVTGPFLPDFLITISSLIFLFMLWLKKDFKIFRNDFFKIIFIFYLYLIFNSLFSEDILMSLKNTLFYFRFIIFAFLLKYLIQKKNFLEYFIKSIIFTLLIVCIDAIIEQIIGFHWLFDKSNYAEFISNNRISGLFDEEFILGGFVLTLFPFSIIFFLTNEKRLSNKVIWYTIFCLIFIYTIIISGERATFAKLVFLIFLIIFLFDYVKTFKKKIFIFFILIFFIFGIVISQPKLKARIINQTFSSFFEINNNNSNYMKFDFINLLKNQIRIYNLNYFSQEHQNHAIISIEMFKDKKLFGYGVKTFRILCSDDRYYINDRACSTHSHGIVLSFISELGLFGLFFLLFAYFFILKSFFKSDDNFQKILLLCIFIYLFPFLPLGYFFNNFFSSILYALVGIYLGVKKLKFKVFV